jgi:Ca-activated chloride channel homolog
VSEGLFEPKLVQGVDSANARLSGSGFVSMTPLLRRIRPRHARGVLVAVAVAAAWIGFLLEPSSPAPRVLGIQYVISPDAQALLAPLISKFNNDRIKSGGKVINVTAVPIASGKAAADMGNVLRPVMWTPASSAWSKLVDDTWFATGVPSLVQSPEVVAIWKTEADRLGLGNTIGFAELADLIKSHELDFGHTDPNTSTSGLFAVLSEFSFLSKRGPADLTVDDVSLPTVQASVRRLEWATVHYVDIARDFAHEWCHYGVSFASAAYMQETTLIGFNQSCQTQLRAVYVTDFPFAADYPFIVLTGPWVSAEQTEAAKVFGAWLDSHLDGNPSVAKNGFRRGTQIVPGEDSGADPTLPGAAPPLLPNAGVLRQMQRTWSELRRPANVVLVADESQQMAIQGKEELMKGALLDFLACPGSGQDAGDRVGMITFGGEGTQSVRTPVPLADFDSTRVPLGEAISALAARGGAALWDAVDQALRTHGLSNPGPVNTVIVLADGSDDGSAVSPGGLEAKLRDSIARGQPIQTLVVQYGSTARTRARLKEHLVSPSLGRYYEGDIGDAAEVNSSSARSNDLDSSPPSHAALVMQPLQTCRVKRPHIHFLSLG